MAGHVTVKMHVSDLQPALRCAGCTAPAATDMICTHKHGQQLRQHLCSTPAESGKLDVQQSFTELQCCHAIH